MKDYFKIKVSRNTFNCLICKKGRPKGTQKIGYRTCFLCALESCEEYKKIYEEEIRKIKKVKITLIKNKDKWERDLFINSI